MTDKEYDKILTEGVRWLGLLHSRYSQMGIAFKVNNSNFKFFLELARMYSVYFSEFYINCSWFRYAWLRWIKKYTFLRRPRNKEIFYIDPDRFLNELAEGCNVPMSTFVEIYKYYWKDGDCYN